MISAFECLGFIVYTIMAVHGNIALIIGIMEIDCLECFRFMAGPVIFAFCLAVIIMQYQIKAILGKAKWLQKFGKISYSFYLMHYIILTCTAYLVRAYSINRIIALVFVFSLSIVCAYIMYWLLEIQLSNLLRKTLNIV